MAPSSPFPPSASAPGEGKVIVQLLPYDISALETIAFQYPLKLISPSPSAQQKSVLVFLLTYGGGLVGGDHINLTIEVRPNAKLSIVTQGHTKVFKSPSRDVVTRQQLRVHIKKGAAVCMLPDPVQPFAGSVYEQLQTFFVDEAASLCLLDWVSEGRTARGEDWDLGAWIGRNEIWATGEKPKLLLRDKVMLEGGSPTNRGQSLKNRMQDLAIFGTLILRGPLVKTLSSFFLSEFAAMPRLKAQDFRSQARIDRDSKTQPSKHKLWRKNRLQYEKEYGVLWSAANIRGCTVVKFGSRAVEGARVWLGTMIKEEGSIEKHFGDDAVMCVK
ncbi:urease accessory protein-like protein UreD [Bisporella sp. PMI_857]|nr:urease accessory protein-like protein UreD [Bisporella sp. PMI_857]